MELPLVLGVSTVVLLGAGLAMYKATQNARRDTFRCCSGGWPGPG